MSASRREVLFLISGFVSSAVELKGLPNQDNSIPSTTYPFSELPIRIANGAAIRPVLKGKLAHSRVVEVHETTLPAGPGYRTPHITTCTAKCGSFGKVRYSSRSMAQVMLWGRAR